LPGAKRQRAEGNSVIAPVSSTRKSLVWTGKKLGGGLCRNLAKREGTKRLHFYKRKKKRKLPKKGGALRHLAHGTPDNKYPECRRN